jgi:hypothetical protein
MQRLPGCGIPSARLGLDILSGARRAALRRVP